MAFCFNCGARIDANVPFCENCDSIDYTISGDTIILSEGGYELECRYTVVGDTLTINSGMDTLKFTRLL